MKNGLEIDVFGTKRWYKDDKFHRDNGPAVERYSGTKEWWQNGLLHRLDGPALEFNNGSKFWFILNKKIQVKYLDQQGTAVDIVLEDFVARVFQHEFDHVQGKVYLDRLESNEDIYSESEYLLVIK